jgi:hypothetical protein
VEPVEATQEGLDAIERRRVGSMEAAKLRPSRRDDGVEGLIMAAPLGVLAG